MGNQKSKVHSWLRRHVHRFRRQVDSLNTFLNPLPSEEKLGETAEQFADDLFEERTDQPAAPPVDLGSTAKEVRDEKIKAYEDLANARQGMVNLFAVGIYHLLEQQRVHFLKNCLLDKEEIQGFSQDHRMLHSLAEMYEEKGWKGADYTQNELKQEYDKKEDQVRQKLDGFVDLLNDVGLDPRSLESWEATEELRLIANTVKHGDGGSCAKLFAKKPNLFKNPRLEDWEGPWEDILEHPSNEELRPMSGRGLFLHDSDVRYYGRAVKRFWNDLFEEAAPE